VWEERMGRTAGEQDRMEGTVIWSGKRGCH
jgi:hypothetical protein